MPRLPPATRLTAEPRPIPAIEVAPVGTQDRSLQEATIMHDQTPLFLPTERNVSLPPLAPLEAGSLLLDRDQAKLLRRAGAPKGLAVGLTRTVGSTVARADPTARSVAAAARASTCRSRREVRCMRILRGFGVP